MPRHRPYRIELTDVERAVLERLARSYTLPYWQVMRAQMVLMAAEGMRNDQIAARLRCGRDVVSQWRKRFFEQRLAGLEDRPGAADRRPFPPQVRAEVIRLACERPADSEVPLARWSSAELAAEVVSRGICEQISGVTVWRWLSEDAIKPWQHRSWIFPRDPKFTAKAGRILDLYGGRWEGELLHPGDYVVCCDEKPSVQARARRHQTLPAAPGIKRGQRVEHEYERARGSVHERRALPQGTARVRDRRQRLRPSRAALNRPVARCLAEPDPRPHPDPCQLTQPSRDLLLDRPAQGPHPQRLPRPRHARATTVRVRPPLRADRHAIRVEIHPRRPRPPRPAARPTHRPSGLNEHVGELPSRST